VIVIGRCSCGPHRLVRLRLTITVSRSLAGYDHAAVVGAIEEGDEVEQFGLERRATGFSDGLPALYRRPVVAPPVLEVRPGEPERLLPR
jgi:hypothetical protein